MYAHRHVTAVAVAGTAALWEPLAVVAGTRAGQRASGALASRLALPCLVKRHRQTQNPHAADAVALAYERRRITA
jgi:hypothetical protein